MDNILEFIEYDNIETELLLESYEDEGILFIPYSQQVSEVDPEMWKDKIVFTHHDIYGSELAGGKVKATFGIDPNIFEGAKLVVNGHVHNRSKVGKVINAGSLFSTQFGELSETRRDKPQFYILDTETLEMTSYDNEDSIMFVTTDAKSVKKDLSKYKNNKKVVRVLYDNEEDVDKEILESDETILRVTYRKRLPTEVLTPDMESKIAGYLDLKVFLVQFIDRDDSVLPEDKSRVIELSKAVLEEGGTMS
jgi:DNA repair exonuclease SbcCD nuclease subunit